MAADLATDVHEVVKGGDEVTGVVQEVVQGGSLGGATGGIGNKALEIMIVQVLAATVPAMVNKVMSAC